MLRRLIVMRHAKSSWDSGVPDDHSRPLNARGRRDAPLVAARLQEIGWAPELVVSSDSERTTETLQRMLEEFSPAPQFEFTRALYHAGIHEIREAIVNTSHEVSTVMVLGHNPGWQQAVAWLSDQQIAMTTANAALLETEGESWREALQDDRTWQLVDVIRPKELVG